MLFHCGQMLPGGVPVTKGGPSSEGRALYILVGFVEVEAPFSQLTGAALV